MQMSSKARPGVAAGGIQAGRFNSGRVPVAPKPCLKGDAPLSIKTHARGLSPT